MASFVDQISQFNPYIQQLPIEEMTQVGMYKQQKYDEGVQKVQSYIDNVAGLDVVRDIDKAYLQSKLNDLGSKLRTVAAGDFSNYQLVNSVGGMATQIVKDPNIQSALSSTNRYRKEVEKMQKDINEGKSSPDNIRKFNKQANNWFSSKNIGENFTGSYIPYFDINKFARETFDAVKPDEYTFDQVYLTDDQGKVVMENIVDPKTKKVVGQKPVFSPIMTRLEQEGKFPKKVRDTLDYIFSDPRVSQQLQITGEYNYEGYEGDSLKNKVLQVMNKKLGIYDSQLVDINIRKALGQDVQADIDSIEANKRKIQASYTDLLKMVDANPDAVRGSIYKDNVYDEFTTMYGSMKEKRTTHENPGWNVMFKMQQEANDQRRHAETLGLGYARLQKEDERHKENVRLQMLNLMAKAKPIDSEIPPTQKDIPSNISFISVEEKALTNATDVFTDAVTDLIIQSGAISSDINKTIENFKGGITPQRAVKLIAESNSKKLGMTTEQYTQWLYNKGIQEMSKVGNANLIYQQRAAKESAENAYSNFRKAVYIRQAIDKKVGVNPMLEITRSLKTEQFTLPTGNRVQLTPQDQYDIAMSYAGSDWYDSAEVKAEAKAAQDRLKKKGFTESDIKGIISDAKLSQTEFSPTFSPSKTSALYSIMKLVDVVGNKENVAKVKDRAEAIKGFYQINPELRKTILTGDAETDRARLTNVFDFISKYSLANLQESPEFKDNVSKMSRIASGEEKGGISLEASKDEITGNVSPKLVFTDSGGGFAGEMTITSEEAYRLGSDVTQWWQPDTYKRAQIALDATGNGTTSQSGNVNDVQTYIENDAYYFKNDFKNLRNVVDDVKGNISVQPYIDGENRMSTLYFGHIYVNSADGKTKVVKTLPPLNSIGEVLQKFDGLSPQMIEQLKIEAQKRK